MKFASAFLSLLSLAAAAIPRPQAPATFSNVTLFTPPSNYTTPRVLYARTAQLPNGDLLATWENYSPEPPPVYFPIYKSTNNGYTWKEISRVQDTANGLGLRYQPHLYVLPRPFGGYRAGTVLLSGSSIPTDLSSTQLDVYASKDSGVTWEFVSHIAAGGVAIPNNGLTPVWEPYLMLWKSKLICYYSDQRDNATYGQKMVHQSTTDLKNWGPVIDDVAYPRYTDRPGMPIVDLLPNGQYIMIYEYGGGPPANGTNYQFPVHYKLAADPTKFGAATGIRLEDTSGGVPNGSPYVVWSSYGGANGTIVASGHSTGDIFLNTQLGAGRWRRVATPQPRAYTRHLRVLRHDPRKLLIVGAGQLPPSTTNRVSASVIDLSEL